MMDAFDRHVLAHMPTSPHITLGTLHTQIMIACSNSCADTHTFYAHDISHVTGVRTSRPIVGRALF